jgi:adenylyltransferase/sulfurtransferase
MSLPLEVTPADVKRRLDAGEKLILLDCREPSEQALTAIPGAELIPMREIPAALTDLEAKAEDAALVVFCHHGVRSLMVVDWLRGQGVANCQSMTGGIDRWSLEVDPAVARY